MPLFRLNLIRETGSTPDPTTGEFEDLETARRAAAASLRAAVGEELARGRLDLGVVVRVEDAEGRAVATIGFTDAITLVGLTPGSSRP